MCCASERHSPAGVKNELTRRGNTSTTPVWWPARKSHCPTPSHGDAGPYVAYFLTIGRTNSRQRGACERNSEQGASSWEKSG